MVLKARCLSPATARRQQRFWHGLIEEAQRLGVFIHAVRVRAIEAPHGRITRSRDEAASRQKRWSSPPGFWSPLIAHMAESRCR